MTTPGPGPWRRLPGQVGLLYVAVLAAGVYDVLGGIREQPVRLAGTAAGLALLAALDAVEGRRERAAGRSRPELRPGAQLGPRLGLLFVRVVSVEVIVALDISGTAPLLRLLVVLWAQLALGARTARALVCGYALVMVVLVTSGAALNPAAHPDEIGGWTDPRTVSAAVMSGVGWVVALVVAGLVTRLDEARSSAQRLAGRLAAAQAQVAEQAAAAERGRLARDIHDAVGHHLTAVSVQLQKAELFLPRDPAVAARAIQDAQEASRQGLAEVRRSVAAARDVDRFELRAALRSLSCSPSGIAAGPPSGAAGPQVRCEVRGDEEAVPGQVLLAVHRVVQEALTNARRHAAASCVRARVDLAPDGSVELTVEDDGRGFEVPPDGVQGPDGGLGLVGMRERVELLGGRLTVASAPGQGTAVRAWLPGATRAAAEAAR